MYQTVRGRAKLPRMWECKVVVRQFELLNYSLFAELLLRFEAIQHPMLEVDWKLKLESCIL